MIKRTLVAALASAIAPLSSAAPIDDLISSSQSIRNSFDYSIKAIGGMAHHAQTGGYATAGLVEQGKITEAQANAYNASVQAFKAEVFSWSPNSQEYFDQQSQQSLEQLGVSIDAFVDAAVAMVTITELNVRANEAAQAPDARESIALQDYMEDTDVLLSEDERTAYNDALQDVEDAAISAAAYTAIANDQELLDAADEAAYALNVTYEEAADSYFDSTTGQMTVEWLNGDASSVIALEVSGYWTDDATIIQSGGESLFWQSSPEGPCWFLPQEEQEACWYGS